MVRERLRGLMPSAERRKMDASRWFDQVVGTILTAIVLGLLGFIWGFVSIPRDVSDIKRDVAEVKVEIKDVRSEMDRRTAERHRNEAEARSRLDKAEVEHNTFRDALRRPR